MHASSKSNSQGCGKLFFIMHRRLGFLDLMLLVALAYPMFMRTAHAAYSGDDTVKPFVKVGTVYDSNLLRISDSVNPVDVSGKDSKSDIITQIRAGFDMDWELGRQHLIVKAAVDQNIFETFSELNYLGWDTLANWKWQIGDDLNGELGYSNKATLGTFAQLNQLIANLQTIEQYFAKGGYFFHPNWQVRAGLLRYKLAFDDEIRSSNNNTEDTLDVGLRYISDAGNMAGVRISLTDGSYPDRIFTTGSLIDNSYIRNKYEMIWDWAITDKTRFDGQVGYLEQHYDHLGALDFSKIIGRTNLNWQVTEKTNLSLNAWRDVYQADNLNASFILVQGIRFTPAWQATSKINLSASVSYEQQDFLGAQFNQNAGAFSQQDLILKMAFILMYQPFDNVMLSLATQHENRDSNIEIRSYQAQSIGLSLQIFF